MDTETKTAPATWDIRLDHLKAGYKDHVVLTDVNGILPGGTVSVILGGSGCGKSTLLRQIIGLSRPMGGSLKVAGIDVCTASAEDYRRIRRRTGVLFQDGALLGALTLAQNVSLPLTEHLRLPADVVRREALRALRMVGLEEFADYYPNELSGGMRKRAGLARAIIAEPKLLLCDEPTSGLDPITAAQMDDLVLAMHRRYPDMTIVVVSHDLASLERIAGNVLVLKSGRSVFCGPLDELAQSSDPYLSQFLRRDPGSSSLSRHEPMEERVRATLDRWIGD